MQEECALSDPQGESDADADIEDTDCRLDTTSVLRLRLVFLNWWVRTQNFNFYTYIQRENVGHLYLQR